MLRLILVCSVLLALAPAAQAASWRAGAAVADVSPPPPGAADPPAFAVCSAFTGPRSFAFDEPYVDVNGDGAYEDGEPFCDANANGRRAEIYTSGARIGSPLAATRVHDPLTARAIAISDGKATAVVVSVVAQGLFNTYIDRMVAQAKALAPSISAMVVSADHNESSPDTLGIYGGPAPPGSPAGVRSGIDDYYMDFLDGRVAQAAAKAATSLQGAELYARQFPLPPALKVNLSDNWPTTDNSTAKPAAIDPKVGVLQARDAAGKPIFTVMSLAAHNQEIGHSGTSELSSDWPGFFAARLEQRVGGMATFLVADNGSEEDPQTEPPLDPKGADAGTYAQAQATGEALADAVRDQLPDAQRLDAGPLRFASQDLCVPIENNLFKAAAAAGLFGQRSTYVDAGGTCVAAATVPDSLMTSTATLDVGPDLQLLMNPGEAFPALVLGSPWGAEDVPPECADRANPPVPTWPSHAAYRFQVGLADDMIGYEIPPWAFIGSYGTFTVPADPRCQTGSVSDPTDSTDSKGHHHKLETEGVGPTASGAVASALSALVRADRPDPVAHVVAGRFVLADGTYSRSAAGAAGILLGSGTPTLDPLSGTLIGAPKVAAFGRRAVTANGVFMDYDGQPQAGPDITTRGMLVLDPQGCVTARYYLDVFPALDASRHLGAAVAGPAVTAGGTCPPPSQQPDVAPVQPAAAAAAGLPAPANPTAPPSQARQPSGCHDRLTPRAILDRGRTRLRGGRLRVAGRAHDRGCAGLARVSVLVALPARQRCRFLTAAGRLTAARSCRRPVALRVRGLRRFSLSLRLRARLPRGAYTILAVATDRAGNVERSRHGPNGVRRRP